VTHVAKLCLNEFLVLNYGFMRNIIKEKSFRFALNIVRLYKELAAKHEFIISKQLLRS